MDLLQAGLSCDPALIFARAALTPDAWQETAVRSRSRQLILNCARQSGKSLTVAAMAIDEAVSHAPALVLVMSPSLRQSQENFRTVMKLHLALGLGSTAPDQESSLRVELGNGSRIIALPGKEETVRGYSAVSLLIIDEASRVDDNLYHATRPMLAVSGGRIVLLSTPFGKRGFFHKEWTEGEGWDRVRITADMCPRIPPSFLEQERRSLPEMWYRQEYFCEFGDAAGAVFAYQDVMDALSDDVAPLFQVPSESAVDAAIQPLWTN
jgi:hypothetical protein